VKPALLARAANRVRSIRNKEPLTTDADVQVRRWMLVDIDPVRPSGISATDEEHKLALARAENIRETLAAEGWPTPVAVDSGNGGHLLYSVQLPNDSESTELLRRTLGGLALRFDDGTVEVDTAVFNAARLVKLPGTIARKGDDLPERPHRIARLLSKPERLTLVERSLLIALAATVPSPGPPGSNRCGFDLDLWITSHGITAVGPKRWPLGWKWIFPICPWNSDHRSGSAYLVQFGEGGVQAGCHHKSCAGKDWQALRDVYEPGWRQHGGSMTEKDSAQYRNGVRAERKMVFETAAEISGRSPAKVPWIIPPWVAAGSMTILSGKVKAAGKTTLIMRMVAAVLDGQPFMDKPTCQTPVVYLSEQPIPSLVEALKAAGLPQRRDCVLLPWSRAIGCSWPEVVRAAAAECKRLGAKILIVDTLHQFAQLAGDAENNSGDALEAVLPLQEAMAEGIAVLLVVHDRKSGGDVSDSGRGSSAFAGVADILISLRRLEGKGRPTLRQIQAISRFSETPMGMIIELTEDGYVAGGEAGDVAAAEAQAAIMEKAPSSESQAMTMKQIVGAMGVNRTTAQRAIDTLLSRHLLVRTSNGRRGDPYRYWAPRKDSALNISLKGQKETKADSSPKEPKGGDRIPDCPWCGGTDWWSLPDGGSVCAHCHPNPAAGQGEGSAESKSWTQYKWPGKRAVRQ